MTSFFALGENIRRHRRSFHPLEACHVAGQALFEHAELNSETFVLRRLARSGPCSEKSIFQALAVVHAQGFCRLEIEFSYSARSHRSPHSSPYSLGSRQYVPDQWRRLHAQPKRTSHNSSYLARVPRQHWHSRGLTVHDVRIRRHDHMTTRE